MTSSMSPAEQAQYYDENLAPPYIIGLIITAVVVTIILGLRIYAQWLIKNLRAWDNILAIIAFLCLVPLNAFTAWQFTKGAGYHISRVLHDDPDAPMNVRSVFIAWYWITILSAQACLWIKLAMLMFIKRVLPCDIPFFIISWWIVCILSVLIGIGSTIEFTVACLPISYYWDRVVLFYGTLLGVPGAADIKVGWCMPMPIYLSIPVIASFITDVFLFLLPLIPLWNMQLPIFKKFSVFLTLSLGLFAIGVDVVRIWEIIHFDVILDATYRNVGGVAWNAIEYNVALVSACIPAMAPLLRRDLWKRGTRARREGRKFMQLDDESEPGNKSERNLLQASPTYRNNDYRVWGDRSETWRQKTHIRRESESASVWSGDTRSDSRALAERERLRKESSAGTGSSFSYQYPRRTSETTTITELATLQPTSMNSPLGHSPPKNGEWI